MRPKTSLAYCIILPILIITFKINPEKKKNNAMHHSGEFVIVPSLFCRMWVLYKYLLVIIEVISHYLLFYKSKEAE